MLTRDKTPYLTGLKGLSAKGDKSINKNAIEFNFV